MTWKNIVYLDSKSTYYGDRGLNKSVVPEENEDILRYSRSFNQGEGPRNWSLNKRHFITLERIEV